MAKINLTGQLHAATKEQIITSADEIFDDVLGQRQSEINQQMSNSRIARFGGFMNSAEFIAGSTTKEGTVIYSVNDRKFGLRVYSGGITGNISIGGIGGIGVSMRLYSNWPTADMYMNSERTEPLKDKTYLLDGVPYTFDDSGELHMVSFRQAVMSEDEYNALAPKDDNTMYMIYEDE